MCLSNFLYIIDDLNNVKATNPGKAKLIISLDNVEASVSFNIIKNPIEELSLSSNINTARTGDVVEFKTVGYDSRGREVKNLPFEYSFSGKAIDKTTTASGLILDDGRFVAEIIGDYLITTSLGNISASKRLKIIDRGVEREIIKVGKGVVSDKHTSDFWVFEGVDGRDYAVTGTWGADGTSFFWDVTDPSNLKKIDSVKVDARTVNDVKVSEDGKLCIIGREGASNRKNGIIIIDFLNTIISN